MKKSQIDTQDHIASVRINLNAVIENLCERKTAHDASKLREPELSGYESLQQAMQGVEYGTPAYKAVLAAHEGIIQHHYAHNSHHPEYWPDGVDDMSLLDVIEMLSDWKAANDRNNGDFARSLSVSIERFEISGQLALILWNTAKELGWIDVR